MPEASAEAEYRSRIEAEGRVWGEAARALARQTPPDWQHMQHLPHHAVVHGRHIRALLDRVRPGWRVLEVGCASGWLSLEMARRGAHVEGWDVAGEALTLAQDYAAQNPPAGSVQYRLLDINHAPLERGAYDLIVAMGVVHHLAEVEAVLRRFRQALKPSGLLFVSDALDTPRANAIVAGGLMMLLPTQLSYGEKLRHLFRLRGRAVANIQASIEARGLSPFEGYGRHQEPERLIHELFQVESIVRESAFTGYVIAQLRLPRRGVIAVGRALMAVDRLLVRLGLLRGLSYVLVARPHAPNTPGEAQ